jgi:hypothetical protein
MNAHSQIDEIRTFLPEIFEVEYEKRAKLRSYRNAASAMVASANSDLARNLAWSAIEYASANLYAPAPLDWLDKVNGISRRLLITAMQAEDMHIEIVEAADAR